ncbi:MAG TPA: GNAT family N-acetyltransferase [Rubricoccaceae bacterium]|nr:GNAT family N-acetyltransferase [Rubricoccaceae bacterium]
MTGAELLPFDDPAARAAYARLQAVSPQATVFSGLPFADAACAAFGLTGRIALVEAPEGAVPAAGAVLFEKRRGPFRAAALPPSAEYVTPLFAAWPSEADLHTRATAVDALLGLIGERFHQAAFRLHPSVTDVRPFAWAGWALTPAYQYEAPLQGGGAPEDAWRRYPRRTLRRHRAEYRVEEGAGHVAAVVALAAASLSRKGMKAGSADAVVRLAEALVTAGHARAFVARPASGGPPEAGIVAAFDAHTAYYWIVGSRPGPAMTVLVGHLAAAGRAAGCARLCFGGANVPSVAEFKRGFGAALVPYFRARIVAHPALRALDRLRG